MNLTIITPFYVLQTMSCQKYWYIAWNTYFILKETFYVIVFTRTGLLQA